MALEKRWLAVPEQTVALQGDECGVLQVANACLFKVKQKVRLDVSGTITIYQVKRVNSNTELELGDPAKDINHRSDLTSVPPGALLSALEQERPRIPVEDVQRAVYEEDPAMALRNFLVDKCGNPLGMDSDNPMFVRLSDGSISIGTVNAEIETQTSRRDNFPDAGDVHDSMRIGNQDGEMSYTENDAQTKFAADTVTQNKLIDVPHDRILLTRNDNGDIEQAEIYDNGTVKRTLTLLYDDNDDLIDVVRS